MSSKEWKKRGFVVCYPHDMRGVTWKHILKLPWPVALEWAHCAVPDVKLGLGNTAAAIIAKIEGAGLSESSARRIFGNGWLNKLAVVVQGEDDEENFNGAVLAIYHKDDNLWLMEGIDMEDKN
jgi:hypothetical protein